MTYSLPEIVRRNNPNRKVPVLFRPTYVTKAQSNELAKIYLRFIRHWRDGAKRLLEAYNPTPLTVDTQDETEAILEQLTAVEAVLLVTATRDIDVWIQNLKRWHDRKFTAMVQSSTGVSVESLIQDQAIRDDLMAALRRNVTLVTSVSDQARERIAQAVWNGWLNRTPRPEIAREINKALGLGRARSLRIAIDQTVKLSGVLDRDRMLEAGIDEFVWRHSGKIHYRDYHKARDGKRFKWSSEVARTDPPSYAPFCFPSGQPVGINDDILKVWRRWYTGDLTEIITSKGAVVRCTPNHPILTTRGWKAAQSINVGDDIIDIVASGIHASNVKVEETQPAIGDLFAASESVFGFVSIDGRGSDFHGDGVIHEDVDVVDTQGGLRNRIVSSCDQGLAKFFLENAFDRLIASTDGGASALKSVLARDRSSNGIVSALNLLESLCWVHISPDHAGSLGAITGLYSEFLESVEKGCSADANSIGDGLGSLASLIGPDRFTAIKLLAVCGGALDLLGKKTSPNFKVLAENVLAESDFGGGLSQGKAVASDHKNHRVESVVTRAWQGHVYNLETKSGWYPAGSIASKNCGCHAQAYIEFDDG